MAVFFRINYIGKNRLSVETKIGLIRITIYIEFANNTIIVVVKNKRIAIKESSKNIENVALPLAKIITIYKNNITIRGLVAGRFVSSQNFVQILCLIMILRLFENTKCQFLGEKLKNLLDLTTTHNLFVEIGFALKVHLKGIISYLLKILSARRKKHGSKL